MPCFGSLLLLRLTWAEDRWARLKQLQPITNQLSLKGGHSPAAFPLFGRYLPLQLVHFCIFPPYKDTFIDLNPLDFCLCCSGSDSQACYKLLTLQEGKGETDNVSIVVQFLDLETSF